MKKKTPRTRTARARKERSNTSVHGIQGKGYKDSHAVFGLGEPNRIHGSTRQCQQLTRLPRTDIGRMRAVQEKGDVVEDPDRALGRHGAHHFAVLIVKGQHASF